jgi:DNA-directed RNA polymerase specialized sigma24 family protein
VWRLAAGVDENFGICLQKKRLLMAYTLGRINYVEDALAQLAREAKPYWRRHLDFAKSWEKFAEKHPAVVAKCVREDIVDKLRASRHSLCDRFGLEMTPSDELEIVEPRRANERIREFVAAWNGELHDGNEPIRSIGPIGLELLAAIMRHIWLKYYGAAVVRALRNAEREELDRDRAVSEASIPYWRLTKPASNAVFIEWPTRNSPIRQEAIAQLVGWVAANINLGVNRRLRAALDTGAGSPSEKLLRELPAATVVEWGDVGSAGFKDFVRRVCLRLEKEGDQAARLTVRGKLANSALEIQIDELAPDEQALEEFALREELHAAEGTADLSQEAQVEFLNRLRDQAPLSQQERRVIELLLEDENRTLGDVAGELGVTAGTVKTAKFRALDKLRRTAGQ